MKKLSRLLIILLTLFWSCDFLSQEQTAGDRCDLTVSLGSQWQSRTILPGVITPEKYIISFSGHATAVKSEVTVTGQTVTINDMEAGDWTLNVNGYIDDGDGVDEAQDIVVYGTVSVTISTGSMNTASVSLNPAQSGQGSLSVPVNWPGSGIPASVDSCEFVLTTLAGAVVDSQTLTPSGASVTYNVTSVNAGNYLLSVKLKSGSTLYSAFDEAVQIYDNLTSSKSFSLSNDNFTGIPSAPSGLSVTEGLAKIILNWSDASLLEEGFRVKRGTDGVNFSVVSGDLAAGTTSWEDTTAVSGTQYYYKVVAFNFTGESAEASASGLWAPPAAPAVAGTTPSTVSNPVWDWNDVTGASKYRYGWSDGTWLTESAVVSQYEASGLGNGSYTLYVQAGDDAGNWSSTGSFEITVAIPNQAPVASSVVVLGTVRQGQTLTGDFTFTDNENDPKGVCLYRWISYSDAGGTVDPQVVGTAQSYTVSGSDVGRYLVFEVTPVATAGTLTGTAVTSAVTGSVARAYLFYGIPLLVDFATIVRTDFDGTNPVTVVSDATASHPSADMVSAMAIGNNTIYWFDNSGTNKLYQADVDGTNQTAVQVGSVTAGNQVTSLWYDSPTNCLYWSEAGSLKIVRCNLADNTTQDVFTGTTADTPVGVVVIGDYVYWTVGEAASAMYSAPKDCSGNQSGVLFSPGYYISSLATDGTSLFLIHYGAGVGDSSVKIIPVDGTGGLITASIDDVVQGITEPGYGDSFIYFQGVLYWTLLDNTNVLYQLQSHNADGTGTVFTAADSATPRYCIDAW